MNQSIFREILLIFEIFSGTNYICKIIIAKYVSNMIRIYKLNHFINAIMSLLF